MSGDSLVPPPPRAAAAPRPPRALLAADDDDDDALDFCIVLCSCVTASSNICIAEQRESQGKFSQNDIDDRCDPHTKIISLCHCSSTQRARLSATRLETSPVFLVIGLMRSSSKFSITQSEYEQRQHSYYITINVTTSGSTFPPDSKNAANANDNDNINTMTKTNATKRLHTRSAATARTVDKKEKENG